MLYNILNYNPHNIEFFRYGAVFMEILKNAAQNAVRYISTIGVADLIDILIVAFIIYKAFIFIRNTNSYNLAKGLAVFLVVLWLSEIFGLTMISYLLRRAVELGLIVLVILFQPEIRRVLERMGSGVLMGKGTRESFLETGISQTVVACTDMSSSMTGALIVFERSILLDDIINTGTVIDAELNSELIKNIFFNKAPLHDGAVIVRNGRIEAAGCVLPLSKNTSLSKDLGMRHRAGLGVSEQSDAVVVIVSEETGSISVAKEGMLKRHQSPQMLSKLLHTELIQEEENEKKGFRRFIADLFRVNADDRKENEK